MDRMDGSSRAGGEFSYLFPDHTGSNDVTVMRFDAHVQYVSPRSGWGFYGQVPLGHLSAGSQSYTPLGDLEVGGVFVPHLSSPDSAIVFHVGVTLPTGASGMNDFLANLVAASTRFNDLYDQLPEAVSLRAGMAGLWRSGQLFGRFDLAIDGNQSVGDNGNVHTIIRLNAGIGADLGQAALMLETVNLYDTGSSGGSSGSSWINTAALSLRLRSGGVQPYAALVFPVDKDANQFMTAALTLGVDGVIAK